MPQDPGQRLQKVLAHLGLGSRRDVEEWIRAGRLTVNGDAAALGTRVREADQVRLDGRLVRRRPAASQQVFVCHRSPGERLHRRAGPHAPESPAPQPGAPERASLFERLPHAAGRRFIAVSPMPHQDGGLELVTSDGELAEKLQRAVRGLTAEFSVRVRGELGDPQLQSVLGGMLDRGATLEVTACEPGGGEGTNRWYSLAVRGASGKDVRQLFERSGAFVSRVLRVRLGPIGLDRTLARGQFRKLEPDELRLFLGREPGPAERARGPGVSRQ